MASASFHSLHLLRVQNHSSIKESRKSSSTLRLRLPKHVSKFSVSTAGKTTFSSSVGVPNGPDPLPLRLTRSPNLPLFWIGVGIGFSSLISLGFYWGSSQKSSWVASSPQKYAWQAFKNIVLGKASGSEKGFVLSVDALETVFDDPTVQKLIYPYLPEQLRNPKAVKWMLHNTQFCQQLQEMLNYMGASEWDHRMMESLLAFDISSTTVIELLGDIGIRHEDLIAKIVANADVDLLLKDPKIQRAIFDYYNDVDFKNLAKFQHDKEVMDALKKLQEVFT